VRTFWRALKHPRNALPALGAGSALLAFAISSGASPVSFRNLGGGLLFFFAASIITHIAGSTQELTKRSTLKVNALSTYIEPVATCSALGLTLIMLFSFSTRAAGSILEGEAEASANPARAEQLYRQALRFNATQPPLHFSYGMWLYFNGRSVESLPHLRYAVARGFNSTPCYAFLAEAEKAAGDLQAVGRTTAQAASVYPKSVFARTRHAAALYALGDSDVARGEFHQALAIDERGARGWWQLIQYGRFASAEAASRDKAIASPAELFPSDCVFAVISDEEQSPSTTAMNY
jgi:tetratricopeptide (TPR) repeat protein